MSAFGIKSMGTTIYEFQAVVTSGQPADGASGLLGTFPYENH